MRAKTLSALLGLVWIGAAMAAAQDAFTSADLMKLRAAISATIAPDGRNVAYVLAVPRDPFEEEDGPAWTELHVVNREGESRGYVTGKVNVENVAWRPGGGEISFLAKREGDEHKSLYVIRLRGGEARRVLSHETDITDYSWAPDGRRVAFLATEPKEEDEKELEEKGFNQIVYEEDRPFVRAWIGDTENPDGDPRRLDLEGSASSVHWSPAGDLIALAVAPTPLVDDFYVRRKLHVVRPETGEVVRRIENPGKLGQVAWSPDGRRLAFVSAADLNDPMEGRLMIASATEDGGAPSDLLPDYDAGHVTRAAWKDSTSLLFLAAEGVWTFLGRVGIDGSGFERLTPAEGPILRDLTLSQEGDPQLSFLGHTPRHPSEVFVMAGEAGRPERVTESNSWLSDRSLAPQEVVSFTARDGLRLEGILVRPLTETRDGRHPLILTVHGGPEAHYSNGWVTSYAEPGQVAAARGFAVFYPNYRGSTGRGVAFSKLGQAEAAGSEFDDLVDGVDHLVETGLVDRSRVGITGGSYGGYASAWGATYYTERFAASVMFVGISDLVSKVGTTDIPHEMYEVHHRKWLWEDWKYFLERSPIYYVEKARTPLLILHGEEDPRVHPSQSLELYRHLEVLGRTPVRLVLYPGEGHGNRRAASRLDFHLRQMRWMEHYLQGPGGDPPPRELDYRELLGMTPRETTS